MRHGAQLVRTRHRKEGIPLAKWIVGIAIGSMIAVALAPAPWAVPIVIGGIGGMIGAKGWELR